MNDKSIHENSLLEKSIFELPLDYHVKSCSPDTTVADVVQLLCQSRIGCLVVTDKNKIMGIFTERDYLVKVAAQKLDPSKTRVAECMTKNPVCVGTGDTIKSAILKMRVGDFRHVLVKGKDDNIEAVISIRDIAFFLVDCTHLNSGA